MTFALLTEPGGRLVLGQQHRDFRSARGTPENGDRDDTEYSDQLFLGWSPSQTARPAWWETISAWFLSARGGEIA